MASQPVIFISHKHADRDIAVTLGRFVKEKSGGNVRVHLSSSPDFEGPRFGKPLNAELKRALGEAESVILIYTTETEDWSYCMWECGMAVDPQDETPTSVVVMQCGPDDPRPFGDQLRAKAESLDSVQAFVKALLTTADFFPRRETPITGFAAEGTEIKEFAADLHAQLSDVISPRPGPDRRTPTTPYLSVRLGQEAADQLRAAYEADDHQQSSELIKREAVITEQFGARNLLGMRLNPGSTLGDVLAHAQEGDDEGDEPRWFTSINEQIQAALLGVFRPVKWAPYKTAKGLADVPFVAASQEVEGVEFDVYIVPISPRPVLARERMLAIDQTYHKNAATDALDEILLASLVKEMGERKATRLPILDDQGPKTIVHKATLNELLARHAIDRQTVEGLTLADLLTEYADALEAWYVEVAPDSTMEEAMTSMNAKPDCEDAYVVEDGVVVGWLTNAMFLQD